MSAGLLMVVGAVMLVVGSLVTVVNFYGAAKNVMRMEVDSFVKRMLPHLLGGLMASAGMLSLIGGFVWFLLEKYAK
jgi:hypothetical protein